MKITLSIFAIFTLFYTISNANAQDFDSMHGSISASTVNVRVGPGTQYPISWVYKQKHWPIEAIAKHQGWYKIRDIDGEEGWVYERFFSKTRYSTIQAEGKSLVNMYKKSNGEKIILKFEAGALVRINYCQLDICHVSYKKTKGWIQKKFISNTLNIPNNND